MLRTPIMRPALNLAVSFAALFTSLVVACTIPACGVDGRAVSRSDQTARPRGQSASQYPLSAGQPSDPSTGSDTALSRYVKHDDGAFAWELVRTVRDETKPGAAGPSLTIHAVRLTSQRWLSAAEVDQPIWTHWLLIAVPDEITSDVPIFMIGGGRRRDTPPERLPGELIGLARSSRSIVAYLSNVPNQPLRFAGDTEDRVEDSIVSRSWVLAAENDDASRVVLFPMVKSAVKGIDALCAFLKDRDLSPAARAGRPFTSGFAPTGVFLTGGSKRGWTTWLTASVDPRVRAMAPLVIDILDLNAQIRHHFAGYGFYAPALHDYVENGVISRLNNPGIQGVVAHVDPLSYLPRVAHLPTLCVSASGDEFFPIDASRFYADKLGPAGRLRVIPNTGHGIGDTSVGMDVLAFKAAVEAGISLPVVQVRGLGTPVPGQAARYRVAVFAGPEHAGRPARASVWASQTAQARDFRKGETASPWIQVHRREVVPRPYPVQDQGGTDPAGDAEFEVPTPVTGYTAFFVEVTFAPPAAGAPPLCITSRPFVVPETLPFTAPE